MTPAQMIQDKIEKLIVKYLDEGYEIKEAKNLALYEHVYSVRYKAMK